VSSKSVSQPKAPSQSQWHARPEGERDRLEQFDTHARLRNGLRGIAADRNDWAGIPMPLEGESLVVEPAYPNAQALMAMCGEVDAREPDAELAGAKVRNSFWSGHKRSDVVIFTKPDGRVDWGIQPGANHLTHDLKTVMCSEAWGVEQESTALQLLGEMLNHHRFKQYLLTGMFLESSARSGVSYLFRRLKPTVAIHAVAGRLKIMCALCLHPIAYYAGSWAGAMCPTDDVIAHLSLMRADEPMYWRRANQHPAWRPEAGV
jgi:hypothetical protein